MRADDTHVVDDVKFAGAVEVDDRHERSRVSIEEEFERGFVVAFGVVIVVIFDRVVVANLQQIVDCRAPVTERSRSFSSSTAVAKYAF